MNTLVRQLAAAIAEQVEDGLLEWMALVIDGAVKVDGIMVRRTREGRLTLSFPSHDDYGNRHHCARPVSGRARREIEREVIGRLRLE